jgi:hypothetical protein
MEPAFGMDFSAVRVHTDARAHQVAADLTADAVTLGSNIFVGNGRWDPESTSGRWLIAHELVHTIQQSKGGLGIQRFVPCTHARLSLEECPSREPGELADSRREPMIVEYVDSPVEGYVVVNFGIGEKNLKPSVRSHPNWVQLIQAMADPDTRWTMVGLSDCHGTEPSNLSLRKGRADAVRDALPKTASAHIASTAGAPLGDCITDNTTPSDRAWNRSVLIALESRMVTFEPTDIKGKRPVPKPRAQPTAGCSLVEQDEIAHAHPIAADMAKKALAVLGRSPTTDIERLLKRYFNDASTSTYLHVTAGFRRILSGLGSSVKIECEHTGSLFYDHFCRSSPTTVTTAYVRPIFGFRVHMCEAGFGGGDLALARTLVHEFSHMFDFTGDEEYCPGGCSASLSRWDAYDNADSFAGFASDAYLTL